MFPGNPDMQPRLRMTAGGLEDPSDVFPGLTSVLIPLPWPRYLASLRGHVAVVYQIAWSPDSRPWSAAAATAR